MVDWNALGTWALAMAAIISSYLAWRSARVSANALRLEATPILTVDLAKVQQPVEIVRVVHVDTKGFLQCRYPSGHEQSRVRVAIVIENVGRSPSVDIELHFEIKSTPVLSHERSHDGRFSIRWPALKPGGRFTFHVMNVANDDVTIYSALATQASITKRLKREDVPLIPLWRTKGAFLEGR